MDKRQKAIAKIPKKQREKIILVSNSIKRGDFKGLDIKKIKGSESSFRVRVGRYRIFFEAVGDQKFIVTGLSKRDDQTYKKL